MDLRGRRRELDGTSLGEWVIVECGVRCVVLSNSITVNLLKSYIIYRVTHKYRTIDSICLLLVPLVSDVKTNVWR
jgi:hypothetical protein